MTGLTECEHDWFTSEGWNARCQKCQGAGAVIPTSDGDVIVEVSE
ncbi:hypothetical protein [Streptomyces sp. DH12]|nr:hypothetical protein [Streptomyces sp. DH12]